MGNLVIPPYSIVPVTKGGTGLSSIGTAGQVLTVNYGATGLQWLSPTSTFTTTVTTPELVLDTAAGITFSDGTTQTTANGVTAPTSLIYSVANENLVAGQMSLVTAGYNAPFVVPYRNGGKMTLDVHYTLPGDSLTIDLIEPAGAEDFYEVLIGVIYSPSTVYVPADQTFTPTEGATGIPYAHTVDFCLLFSDGIKLIPGQDYTDSPTGFTFIGFVADGVEKYEVWNLTPITIANTLPLSGGTLTGLITTSSAGIEFSDGSIQYSAPSTLVRQSVNNGAVNSSGYANMLSPGIGLSINLSASIMPMRTVFAAGVKDYIATLTNDATGVVSLPPNNLSFISQDYVSPTSVSWNSTLALPQYGQGYQQVQRSNLPLNGSISDYYNNTWAATNVTFGNTNPAISGTSYAMFNGTTSSISTNSLSGPGVGGWSLRCRAMANTLNNLVPGSQSFFGSSNAGAFSVLLGVLNTGHVVLYLSSTGTSWDIAAATLGTTILVQGQWHYFELTYDVAARVYRVYVDGVQDQFVASTAVIAQNFSNGLQLGAYASSTGWYLNGAIQDFEFVPYCQNTGGTTYMVPITPPATPATGYAFSYNQGRQAVLQFGGTSGSTQFLDDFGNLWYPKGGAKIQNTQYKFGTGALGGSGTSNALNGTSDYIQCSSFNGVVSGGWSIRCWIYPTNATAAVQSIFSGNSATVPNAVLLRIDSSKLTYILTSASGTIVSAISAGSNTISNNSWYFVELTYDPIAGKYFGYVNGVLDYSFTSTLVVPSISIIQIACENISQFYTGYIDKFEYLPYCQHPGGITYSVPTVAPNIATPGYSSDFFSIANATMYQVSGPSAAPGVNPAFAAVNRVYVGEATTSSTLVSNVTSYALKGQYDSGLFYVTSNLLYNKNHNLGYSSFTTEVRIADDSSGTNERHGDDEWYQGSFVGWSPAYTARNSIAIMPTGNVVGSSGVGIMAPSYYRILTRRGW